MPDFQHNKDVIDSRRPLMRRAFVASVPAAFIALAALIVLWPHPAMAQAATMGDMMCNAYDNLAPYANIINIIVWTMGGILIGIGLLRLKEHSDSPQNHPLHQGIYRIAGGAALMTLPFFADMVINTLFLVPGPGGNLACAPGAIVDVGNGGVGLDVLVTNFVGDITVPLIDLISVTAFVMGVLFIALGIIKGAKYGTDPRANSIPHILIYLVIGALLISAGESCGTVLFSLFGNGVSDAINYATNVATVLGWNSVQALGGNVRFATTIAAALTFFQLVGILAFVRGLYIVKNAVEGSGQATMAQGFTHMIGGVLAINIYTFLELMDTTFGTGLLV